jgi:hypothetical protein
MRDLLNILEDTLTESVGLANRKAGDQFTDAEGSELTFQSLDFFPERGKYPDLASLDAALKQVFDAYGIQPQDVEWTNAFNKSMLAFGIAHFTDDQGQDYYFGRWFREISPNRQSNNFPNNAIPGGFRLATGAGKKETSEYKPSKVLTQFEGNTPESIYQQIVAKFGEDSPEVTATQVFMAARSFPVSFPKNGMDFAAFRDYFCEMLQPMALVLGKPVQGNAAEAAEIFFGGSFDNATISFNQGETGGLYDSLLTNPDGKQIKVSSKGKGGATASAVNLLNSVRELEGTPQGQKLLKKHADVVGLLHIINDQSAKSAPLVLAKHYGILDDKDIAQIRQLDNLSAGEEVPQGMLNAKLTKMYNERTAKDPSKAIPSLHMLTVIAFAVADKINESTNFSGAASEILNNAALIQMYTDAKDGKDTITLQGFRAVYPSTAVTGVVLDPSKTYYSTGGKGKFTFKILKNGAKAEEVGVEDNAVDTKPDPDSDTNLVDVGKRRSNIKASGLKQPDQDVSNLGRKRRKPI